MYDLYVRYQFGDYEYYDSGSKTLLTEVARLLKQRQQITAYYITQRGCYMNKHERK